MKLPKKISFSPRSWGTRPVGDVKVFKSGCGVEVEPPAAALLPSESLRGSEGLLHRHTDIKVQREKTQKVWELQTLPTAPGEVQPHSLSPRKSSSYGRNRNARGFGKVLPTAGCPLDDLDQEPCVEQSDTQQLQKLVVSEPSCPPKPLRGVQAATGRTASIGTAPAPRQQPPRWKTPGQDLQPFSRR